MKVFDKAQQYYLKSTKKGEKKEVIPVVLLDEVGIAEISKYNLVNVVLLS